MLHCNYKAKNKLTFSVNPEAPMTKGTIWTEYKDVFTGIGRLPGTSSIQNRLKPHTCSTSTQTHSCCKTGQGLEGTPKQGESWYYYQGQQTD